MKSLYTKTLPCLQTIGPWWTESDRRTLFCYLLKIFPFDAEYLSTLPAAIFLEDNDARHLTAIEIQSEYDFFCIHCYETFKFKKKEDGKFYSIDN